jgi:hypothetical protein
MNRQQSTSISGKHHPENHKGEGSALSARKRRSVNLKGMRTNGHIAPDRDTRQGACSRPDCAVCQPIGSILPATGIMGAVLLSVMTISYLEPSRSRHCPPTSGVLAMFFCANGGRSLPFHAM